MIRNFFAFCLPALFIFLGFSQITLAADINYTTMQESTVKISVGNSSFGSGIIVNNKLDIITNYHVIEEAISDSENNLISICFQIIESEKPKCLATAAIEKSDKQADLALLSITPFSREAAIDIRNFVSKNSAASISKDSVTIGNTVHVFGYPGVGGETITYTQGVVSGFDGSYIKIDAKLNAGNSGGGVFNDAGNIVGMATLVTGGVGNIGWIIDGTTLEAFIENSWSQATQCGENARNTNGICSCQTGYTFESANTSFNKDCIPITECSADNTFFNAQSGSCSCQSGYKLDESENSCVEIDMCDGTNVSFDESSFSCSCNENYTWENRNDANNFNCVLDTCMAENNSIRDSELGTCSCEEGFQWEFPNRDSNYVCIPEITSSQFPSVTPAQQENSSCGKHSFSVGDQCFCDAGYTWEDYNDADNYNCSVVITGESVFNDIHLFHKYHSAISYVYDLGIVKGYEDGTYRPDNSISRAEFTKMILLTQYSSSEISRANNADFSDVSNEDWFTQYVGFAQQIGIINGYSDGTFGANNPISIAEAAKIVGEVKHGSLELYGEWYTAYIDYINGHGVNITQKPGDELTRGLMAYILYRLAE